MFLVPNCLALLQFSSVQFIGDFYLNFSQTDIKIERQQAAEREMLNALDVSKHEGKQNRSANRLILRMSHAVIIYLVRSWP